MAGRGMGCATRGGGAVESGPKNRVISETSKTTGPVMMKNGGAVNQHKRMAMGEKVNGMMTGGMAKKGKKYMGGGMVRGYRKGGMCD
jgi:hypothetical protein